MPSKGRVFYVAGAGIAGLCLALALGKFGARVAVLERSKKLDPFGAGIQVSPNARRVLDTLGLSRALKKAAFEPDGIDLYSFNGADAFFNMRLGDAVTARFGAPYAVMHRADLVQALYAACKRFANIDVQFGVEDFTLRDDKSGLTISARDQGGTLTRAKPFAFIGADGVNSPTRGFVAESAKAVSSGYVAWRALVASDKLAGKLSSKDTSLLFGPGFHAVIYPLPHRQAFNIALFAPQRGAQDRNLPQPQLPSRAVGDPRFRAILDAVGEDWTFWPLASVHCAHWHRGRVGLIGDAAHAMLPFQAQGAAMAIEDVGVLAPLLMEVTDAPVAFSRFAALRMARVERAARLARSNARAFHLYAPLSLARDLVIKAQGAEGHLKRLGWLYAYDAQGVGLAGVKIK